MIRKKRLSTALYRSGYEETIINGLRRANVKHTYESLQLQYVIPETKHKYTPDVILENGIICELKGYMDASTRKKMLLVVKQNPLLDIRMVFQNPKTKITKSSKTTYAMWADKNKIKWGTELEILAWSKEKPNTK